LRTPTPPFSVSKLSVNRVEALAGAIAPKKARTPANRSDLVVICKTPANQFQIK
jgi:hypothetical protein